MVIQIGIKIDQRLLEQFKKFAKENGTSLSSLMRQATVSYIKQNNNLTDTGYKHQIKQNQEAA